MTRAAVVVCAVVILAGCTELYRWPDRMTQREPVTRYEKAVPQGHYLIKSGDTLYSIAFRHQLDFRDLAVWNDIGPDYLIRAGQILRLSPPLEQAGADAPSIQTFPAERPAERREPQPQVVPTYEPPEKYSWQWPTVGAVVKSFSDGNSAKGVDIAGSLGQAVLAAAPGKVVYSGSALKGYGELIIIKHDDLFLSAYGYNRRRLVDEGSVVALGQPIAELGLGPEQKPILHFEIREKGKPVNPLKLLPNRKDN